MPGEFVCSHMFTALYTKWQGQPGLVQWVWGTTVSVPSQWLHIGDADVLERWAGDGLAGLVPACAVKSFIVVQVVEDVVMGVRSSQPRAAVSKPFAPESDTGVNIKLVLGSDTGGSTNKARVVYK
jgi:hypothetical protein